MKYRSHNIGRAALPTFLLIAAGLLGGCSDAPLDSVQAQSERANAVPIPVVQGPVTGGLRTGEPFGTSMFELAPNYIEQEFIIQGTARDLEGAEAPYTTRMVVRRPRDVEDFNGIVLVDWNNVTLQFDLETAWIAMGDILMPRGYVYVGVSAQKQGVDGSPLGVFFWDPARYGSLQHPGDDYSFDIFAQAGQALLDPLVLGPDLLERMEFRIATGASQSAGRLSSYINNVHEKAPVYDAFMPQIAGASNVRKDIGPQLWLLSQDEAGPSSSPPDDTDAFRYWEVPGSPHTTFASNAYIRSVQIYNFVSAGQVTTYNPMVDRQYGEQDLRGNCTFNRFPAGHAWSASLIAMTDWLRTGTPPASAPRLVRNEAGDVQFDEHGNALGGIRSPVLDVPIGSYYAGVLPPADTLTPCAPGGVAPLLGTSRTFSSTELSALYASHDDYLGAFEASADEARAAGWLLPEHHDELMRFARAADVTDPVGQQIPTAPGVPPLPIPIPNLSSSLLEVPGED